MNGKREAHHCANEIKNNRCYLQQNVHLIVPTTICPPDDKQTTIPEPPTDDATTNAGIDNSLKDDDPPTDPDVPKLHDSSTDVDAAPTPPIPTERKTKNKRKRK